MTYCEERLVPETHYKCLQSNAHQCGLLTRASRALFHCRSLDQAVRIFGDTLFELGLSGCFSIGDEARRSQAHVFGDKLSKETFDEMLQQCTDAEKVCVVGSCLMVRTKDLKLLGCMALDDAIVRDLIQDNLAIFCDSFQAWLDRFLEDENKEQRTYHDRLRYADKMNEILGCISRFNLHLIEGNRDIYQDLLSALIAKFPSLGLEADQEETILNLIEGAKNRQEKHLIMQLKYNDDLKEIISTSVENILDQIEWGKVPVHEVVPLNIKSAELF